MLSTLCFWRDGRKLTTFYILKWYILVSMNYIKILFLMQTNMTQGQRRRLSNGLVTGHAYSVTGYAQVNGHLNMLKTSNDKWILFCHSLFSQWFRTSNFLHWDSNCISGLSKKFIFSCSGSRRQIFAIGCPGKRIFSHIV